MIQDSDVQPPIIPPAPHRREAPRYRLDQFEYPDVEFARILQDLFGDLSRFVDNFYYAVRLFDFTAAQANMIHAARRVGTDFEAGDLYRSWMRIAARDGAMTLFHIAKTLDAINAAANKCKLISNSINRASLKSARLMFLESFPNFDAVRHSVAHSGELFSSEKARKENSINGDFEGFGIKIEQSSGTIITEALCGREFVNTYDGKVVSYSVSWENWKVLDDMLCALFLVFTSGK